MTSVGSLGSSATYAQILANAQRQIASARTDAARAAGLSPDSATSVTLSDAAKSAMAEKDYATVVADTRAAITALLAEAGLESPLADDGSLAIDLGELDRRALYAVSTNADQQFTVDEQRAAATELRNRFDQALAGPTAVGRVTGSIKGLYTAALAWFDAAGPEEKASAGWADQHAALQQMLARIEADPATLPGAVENDPIADYMERLAAGETGQPRDIADVATDARATLDAQYADGAGKPDYSEFDSRSLAAVALNTSGSFSAAEVRAASSEMRARSGAALMASLKSAGQSTDPGAFARNVISLYGAMSPEERAAAGWSENLYAAAIANYQTASKLSSMLGEATGSASFGTDAGSGSSMSLLSYL